MDPPYRQAALEALRLRHWALAVLADAPAELVGWLDERGHLPEEGR
jgi:hypothetical protein